MSKRTVFVAVSAALLALLAGWIGFGGRHSRPDPGAVPHPEAKSSRAETELAASKVDDEGAAREALVRAVDSAAQTDRSPSTRNGHLHGVVLNPRGMGIGAADVTVDYLIPQTVAVLDFEYAHARERVAATRCDSAGRFEIAVPVDRALTVAARAPGFARTSIEGVHEGEEVTLRLTPAARISGNVRLRGENVPLADVWIGVRKRETGELLAHDFSDSNGDFALADLPAGLATLHAISARAVVPTPALLELAAGSDSTHDFELDPGVTLAGRVSDALSHQPIVGAEIAADWTSGKSTRSDENGRYSLNGFAGKRLHVRASGYCGWIRRFDTAPSEDATVDVELSRGRSAEGRVVSEAGVALSGVYVAIVSANGGPEHKWQDWRTGRTDGGGQFRVGGIDPSGDHTLFLQSPGRATLTFDFPPNEHDFDGIELGEIILPPAGSLIGVVQSEREEPLADIRLRLSGTNSDSGMFWTGAAPAYALALVGRRDTRSGAQGAFAFPDLGAGHYKLEAWVALGLDPTLIDVEVRAGPATTSLTVTLDAGEAIEGRVESPEGNGLPSVVVQAFPNGDESGEPLRAVSGPDGRFVFRGLVSEEYELVADPSPFNRLVEDRYLSRTIPRVDAGERSARLVLQHAAILAGRVTTANGTPARAARVSVYQGGSAVDTTNSDGLGAFRLTVSRGVLCRIAVEWTTASPAESVIKRASVDEVEPGRPGLIIRLDP
jgi:hypothetical protein